MKDYVSSAFRSGPNIKETPRKQPHFNNGEKADTVECSIYKDTFRGGRPGGGNFSHVMFCIYFRLKCETCGRKSKEINYLLKQMKRFHSNPTTGFAPRIERMMKKYATATTDKSCEAQSSVSVDPDRDELGEDPNIDLDYDVNLDEEIDESDCMDREPWNDVYSETELK